MKHLLFLCCVLAACGNPREDFQAIVKGETETTIEKIEKVEPEESVAMTIDDTDAAGRAYLAKLAAAGDTACACKSEECGKSVMQSWMMGSVTSNHTLDQADLAREQKLLERLFKCAAMSAPEARVNIAKVKEESKAARAKVFALIDDSYEGETEATRKAIHALKRDVRKLCECKTLACIERMQNRFSDPPVVTTEREIKLVTGLLGGVMTCGTITVADEMLTEIE